MRRPYRATYSLDGKSQRPAIGLDISGGGLCILTQEAVSKPEFDVRATLEQRAVHMRVRTIWQDNVTHSGKTVWRYGLRYSGIQADDWDAVIRFSTGKPVAESNKAQDELVSVRMNEDESARLIPLALQNKLLQMLVDRRRLAPLDGKANALVQYFYSGLVRHDGKPVHRLTIQSKIVTDEGEEMYETRFVFDENGENIAILG